MHYMDQSAGLTGWQWLYLLEGAPTIIVGLWTFKYLTDRPAKAEWLTDMERNWLVERMRQEEMSRVDRRGFTLLQSLMEPRILLLCFVCFSIAMGAGCYAVYHPSVLHETFPRCNKFQIGLLAAMPSSCAIVAMVCVGLHSDRVGERRWHVALPGFVAAGGWMMVVLAENPYFVLTGMTLAHAGMLSMLGPFWSLSTSMLSGAAAAGGIAFINSVGNLGGFVGNNVIGMFKEATGIFAGGFVFLACSLVIGGILVLLLAKSK
jgi:MFS transporter, ACS family, tartrate transporter